MVTTTNKKWLYNISMFCKNESRKVYFLLSFFTCNSYYSQVNMVLNPSFEDLDSCNLLYTVTQAIDWTSLQPYPCTPLLFNTCGTNTADCGVPVYIHGGAYGFQWPRTGNGYIGSHVFTPPPSNSIPIGGVML